MHSDSFAIRQFQSESFRRIVTAAADMKIAFYWCISCRSERSADGHYVALGPISLNLSQTAYTLPKKRRPCTAGDQEETKCFQVILFRFIFFRAFLVRRKLNSSEGTTRAAAVERPTHLPTCICLDLKIWKGSVCWKGTKCLLLIVAFYLSVCGSLQSKKLNTHFYTLRKWEEEERRRYALQTLSGFKHKNLLPREIWQRDSYFVVGVSILRIFLIYLPDF